MREELEVGQIKVEGQIHSQASYDCTVVMRNQYDQIMVAFGATNPTDGLKNFGVGCMFINTATGIPAFNIGTAASCNFDVPTLA